MHLWIDNKWKWPHHLSIPQWQRGNQDPLISGVTQKPRWLPGSHIPAKMPHPHTRGHSTTSHKSAAATTHRKSAPPPSSSENTSNSEEENFLDEVISLKERDSFVKVVRTLSTHSDIFLPEVANAATQTTDLGRDRVYYVDISSHTCWFSTITLLLICVASAIIYLIVKLIHTRQLC